MQTETPVQWEEKTLIVYGATDATQLVFESVEETKANRWFLDDVRIVKAGPDDKPSVDLIPLAVPAVTFDQDAATESSVKFAWTEVSAGRGVRVFLLLSQLRRGGRLAQRQDDGAVGRIYRTDRRDFGPPDGPRPARRRRQDL